MAITGILNVNKPAGWTSFDVVNFLRRRSGVKRVGHAGTLDPAATGVLPVLLGQATRLTEYLVDSGKTYVAGIELGIETDTYDAEGQVLRHEDASGVSREAVEAVLEAFRGEIEQVPPAFSAIKRDGQPLYKAARRGELVELEPRRVRVDRLDITSFSPPLLAVELECSKGFYVRSLAHDIGQKLGVGGRLSSLVRTRVGPFRIEEAVDAETLGREMEAQSWQHRLVAADEVLLGWQAAILGEASSRRLLQGQTLSLPPLTVEGPSPGDRCRAYSAEGDFLAVLRCASAGQWRPEKVFAGSEA